MRIHRAMHATRGNVATGKKKKKYMASIVLVPVRDAAEVEIIADLEAASYPPDEAATKNSLLVRSIPLSRRIL